MRPENPAPAAPETPPDRATWLEAVVARYERPLCQYAYRLTGNFDAARDAVQDTFLRLCRAGVLEEARTAPWLFRVCRNRCIDLLRKERPMQPLTDAHAARAGPAAHPAAGAGRCCSR